jgi:hypothetical protein
VRSVPGKDAGDRLADAAGRPGDDGHLPVERAVPVPRGGHRGREDPDDLTGDVRRLDRQQEAQRGLDALLGAGGDVDELGCRTTAELLAHRAREALQRALGGRLGGCGGHVGRGAEDDDATVRVQGAGERVEEVVERAQAGRGGDPGSVEDERGEIVLCGRIRCGHERCGHGLGGLAHLCADGVEHLADRVPHAAGAAEHDGPRDERVARPVAAQVRRVGQAQPPDQRAAETGVGEAGVPVTHGYSFRTRA